MLHEPDWDALNELNFLLYSRIADPLNAALSAMTIAEMPENAQQIRNDWWRSRAKSQISMVLNLFMAWSWLIQFKAGTDIPDRAVRPFYLQTLLTWLTLQLQLVPPLVAEKDILLIANQESLQEALLLLHSVAAGQGTGTKVIVERAPEGVRFRIRFKRMRRQEPYTSIDEMLRGFGSHWRMQVSAFELKIARDFLEMNRRDLGLQDDGKTVDFTFTIKKVADKASTEKVSGTLLRPAYDTRVVKNLSEATWRNPRLAASNDGISTLQVNPRRFKERWHAPQASDHITVRAAKNNTSMTVDEPVPQYPSIPGGWHLPARGRIQAVQHDSQPIIVRVPLPEPDPPPPFVVKSRRMELQRQMSEPQEQTPESHDDLPNIDQRTQWTTKA